MATVIWRAIAGSAHRCAAVGMLLGCAALVACGDGLVDQGFRGISFWSYGVATEEGSAVPENPGQIWMALFFAPRGIDEVDVEQMIELPGSTTAVQAGTPARMDVFELPGPELFAHSETGEVLDYAVARILAYEDTKANGRRDKGEYFRGIVAPYAFIYTPTRLTAEQSPTAKELSAGFSSLLLPQGCGRLPPAATDPGTCNVNLGDSCRNSAECNGGTCLRETQLGWPAGYCTITEPVASGGCRPGTSEVLFRPEYSPTPPDVQAYYLRRCTTSADCERPGDRDRNQYGCDPGLYACVPQNRAVISVFGPVEVASVCSKPLIR